MAIPVSLRALLLVTGPGRTQARYLPRVVGMVDTRVLTVLERMVKAGISEDGARAHIAAGRVRVGDDPVTDPDMPDDSAAGPGIHLDPA